MRFLAVVFSLIGTSAAWSQMIQVPENCLNRTSPCLLRTEDETFMFKMSGLKVVMQKETILKISKSESDVDFEIIDGRISMVTQDPETIRVTINKQVAPRGRLLVNRSFNKLQVLNLNDYMAVEYRKEDSKTPFIRVKKEFINKYDFISFTKNYFESSHLYKTFLEAEAPKWKDAFEKQNNSQDAIMLRRIASEREKARVEAERRAQEAEEIKNLRAQFFYRTFKR